MSACSSLETVSWNRIAFKRRPIAQMRRGYELSAVNLRAVRCLIVQYRTSDVVNLCCGTRTQRGGGGHIVRPCCSGLFGISRLSAAYVMLP